jgi:polysaccharide biosynthesis protein PslH
VLLAPVFSGKGTRYKILEALASGTPVVATPTAVEGLNLKHNQHVLISNDPETLAQYVVKLFTDQKLLHKLSTSGKKYVKQYYDWQPIANKLDKIYQSMQPST